MQTATAQALRRSSVVHLPTQPQRAKFCREEMKKQSKTIVSLCDETGLCWATIAKYMDLAPTLGATMDPRTDTTRKLFHALGFDLCFRARRARGMVEL